MPSVRFLVGALGPIAMGLVLAGSATPALAQAGRSVVQSTEGARLNAALGRLARNPRDIDALVEAGIASMAAGDGEAAIGFYQKADALSPNTARIKAGLAGAYAVTGDAASAIPLFDAAERLGMIDAARTADRGLAFDMVGDPVTAQRYYHEALIAGPNEETSRRLALSQAIAGDRRGMEVTLGPLLQRQDKASWRTRAFALAILGQAEEAESIAKSTMPADLAAAMTNYLRYMTKLTPAQQTAAANLGQFPRAAEIGRADPRLAALVRARPVLASATPSRAAATAAAQRSDRRSREDRRSRDRRSDEAAPAPKPAVAVAAAAPLPVGELPPLRAAATTAPTVAAAVPAAPVRAAPAPVEASPYTFGPAPVRVAAAPAPMPTPTKPAAPAPAPVVAAATIPAPAPAAAPVAVRSEPGFASLDPAGSAFNLKPAVSSPAAIAVVPAPKPVVAAPAPAPKPAPSARPRSLAEVFADLTPPSREAEPKAGAVDLRKIKTAAPARTAEAKASDSKTAKLAAADCEPAKPAKGKAAPAAKGKASATAAQCKLDPKAQAAKDAKDAKAREKAAPSRYWVQVATGRDKKALAFDWRKLAKEEAVLKGRKAFTTPWGQANRLLTGPFDSAAQAGSFLAQAKKAGIDGAFVFNSTAGQDVDPLAGT